MAEKKNNLNGSVNLLADAMRKVFHESMESVHEAVKGDIDALGDAISGDMANMENRLGKRIDDTNNRLDNTKNMVVNVNQNMQAQFAEQEKKIATMFDKQRSTK